MAPILAALVKYQLLLTTAGSSLILGMLARILPSVANASSLVKVVVVAGFGILIQVVITALGGVPQDFTDMLISGILSGGTAAAIVTQSNSQPGNTP